MRASTTLGRFAGLLFLGLMFVSVDAHAQLSSANVLDSVMSQYKAAASTWSSAMMTAATFLFWSLVVISMVWTFGFMALRRADVGEFFAEFIRFTIFVGFFFWLLTNGTTIAMAILNSFQQLGTNAIGGASKVTPSSIVDIGFQIFDTVVDQSSAWSPVTSGCGIIMGAIILVVLALVATNMLILMVSSWVLAYGGIFFLGFGGSRWTSEMALSYYKTTIACGAQLMAMILIVGIGQTFITGFHNQMAAGLNLKDMAVMLVASAVLLALANKVPGQLGGFVSGGAVQPPAGFGAGAALGAGAMAAAAVATGGAAMAAGAKNIAGGVQALMAAVGKANENMATGSGMFAGSGMGAGGKSGGGGGAGVAAAMGGNGGGATPISSTGGGSAGSAGASGVGGGGDSGSAGAADAGGSGAGSGSTEATAGSGGSGEPGAGSQGGSGEAGAGPQGESTAAASGSGNNDAGQNAKSPSAARQMASVAGRFSADVAANLAKGTMAVGKAKLQATGASLSADIGKTVGGKIAAQIAGTSVQPGGPSPDAQGPSFGQNSIGGAADTSVDRDAEKAAFSNRKSS
jgi:type IV secretion system protein TrbL